MIALPLSRNFVGRTYRFSLAIVLFCLGLILFRTPLSFSDYSGTAGNEGHGLAFGTESCKHT